MTDRSLLKAELEKFIIWFNQQLGVKPISGIAIKSYLSTLVPYPEPEQGEKKLSELSLADLIALGKHLKSIGKYADSIYCYVEISKRISMINFEK